MGTAVGDLVYALVIDDANWKAGIGRGISETEKFDNHVSTKSLSAKKSLGFIAKGFYEAGESASVFSREAGAGLSALGSSISTIIVAEETVTALGKAYRWLAAQQAIVSALSGPYGWATLAAGAAAAGGAYYFFSQSSEKVSSNIEDNIQKIGELTGKLKELEEGRREKKETYLRPGAEGYSEFVGRYNNLEGAKKQLDITREQIAANEELIKKINLQTGGWASRPEGATDAGLQKQYDEAIKRREILAATEREGVRSVKHYEDIAQREETARAAADAEEEFTKSKQEQTRAYEELLSKMMNENAMIGETEAMKEKMALAESKLYTPEQLIILGRQIDRKYELLAAEEERKRALEDELSIMQEAAGIWQENQTAEEKYYDSIQRNQELYWAGLLDDEMLQRANMKALDEWSRAEKGNAAKAGKTAEGPKALEKGSQEAWQFIVSAMNPATDANLEIADNTKRAADALDRIDRKDNAEVGLPA